MTSKYSDLESVTRRFVTFAPMQLYSRRSELIATSSLSGAEEERKKETRGKMALIKAAGERPFATDNTAASLLAFSSRPFVFHRE